MGYVTRLRETVGDRPLVVVEGAAVVVDRQQRILLVRRDQHTWGLPAGSKELNESVMETAVRELYEETNLVGNRPELLAVVSGQGMQCQYANGDQVDAVTVVFRIGRVHAHVFADSHPLEHQFFRLKRLPGTLTPLTREVLRLVDLSIQAR